MTVEDQPLTCVQVSGFARKVSGEINNSHLARSASQANSGACEKNPKVTACDSGSGDRGFESFLPSQISFRVWTALWREAGRDGRPHHYSAYGEAVWSRAIRSAERARAVAAEYGAAGCDELICFVTVPMGEQADRL